MRGLTLVAGLTVVLGLSGTAASQQPALGGGGGRAEWSPDGSTVIYRSDAGGGSSLWKVPADGSGPASVFFKPSGVQVWEGVFAPGGQTLVYRAGSIGTGEMPVWSHDGRRLYFIADRDIVGADLAFAPSFSVTRRANVIEGDFAPLSRGHAVYDAMRDGRSLLLVKAVSDAQTMVVLNWTNELRAAVAKGARR